MATKRGVGALGCNAVAIAALLVLAGCGSDHSSGASSRLRIDERAGTVRGVGIGSSKPQIAARFGDYGRHPQAYPIEPLDAGSSGSGGPYSVNTGPYHLGPGGPKAEQVTLRYRGASFFVLSGRAFGFMVTAEGAATERGVAVGDPLADAKRAYPELKCEGASAGETSAVQAASCHGRLSAHRFVWFGGDPNQSFGLNGGTKPFSGDERIESITLQKWDFFGGPLAY
jgi:hypothetical protein